MYHYRRTETRLVREHAALEALLCGEHNCAAEGTADKRFGLKCVNENCLNGGDNACVVDGDDNKAARYEKNDHEGYDFFGYACDSFKSAQGNKRGKKHYNYAKNYVIKRNAAHNLDRRERRYVKRGGYVGYDFVNLTHAADTEGGEHSENAEKNSQNLAYPFAALLCAQSVAQIVHCAARPFAVIVFAAEEDTEHVFGIVGHHAEECGYPHPENGTCAAYANCGGYARDVTGSYRCGKGGTKRLERRNGSLFLCVTDDFLFKKAADCVFPPVAEV